MLTKRATRAASSRGESAADALRPRLCALALRCKKLKACLRNQGIGCRRATITCKATLIIQLVLWADPDLSRKTRNRARFKAF